ncbi:very short patch repair endonuclease [Nocardioides cavernaquae]|uniref:Very short patch repair endonuclease n=1 Tax=Nocardioides cavernaquae TaxID=2321396 RepID=A0A3A5H7H1_9ACTN|nr:very short patch repair endonuclease [Nocardioides cavernaquae]RJS45818.1 DNA mismatch endonuclease Vsr [Nocardioides cavernaquae]
MVDVVDATTRSRMMAGIRSSETKPELTVRRALHAAGFRFRLHVRSLPGSPDVVLPRYHAVVFVHGCFWHGHEDCKYFRIPTTRTEFWMNKFDTNRRRDAAAKQSCLDLGWRVAVVWECSIRSGGFDVEDLAGWLRGSSETVEFRGPIRT